jgi:spore maturation protein CgeB
MHILIVGSDKIFSIERFYAKYLRKAGVNLSVFVAPNIFNDHYRKHILNRILFRIGLSDIYERINNEFKETVEEYKPDIIWIFKGMEIFPSSLVWAKQRGIKLVNYNPDNPFLFSGKGSGNRNVTDSISLYDLHFTYNLRVKRKLENDFDKAASFLPFGFDVLPSVYNECISLNEINEVCFLGNPDKKRAAFIESLALSGLPLAVYGHGWKNFVDHPGIKIFEAVYGEEQWRVLRMYRVQLNLMRAHNEDSHNMRTFEVPAIGGIMLAPDTAEHRIFFADGLEVFLFRDLPTCIELIEKILGLTKEESVKIRSAARARSLVSGYNYEQRSHQALAEIEHKFIHGK